MLFLVLSVGLKLVIDIPSSRLDERESLKGGVAAFLSRQGFQVNSGDREETGSPFLQASRGECRFLVVVAAPEGWHRDIIHQQASGQERVFFVFTGAVYPDQPSWRSWAYHYWRRLNGYVGHRLPARPVLGIVTPPECDLGYVAWREIAELTL